jgi:predicted enzyme related to lactoylglutathione lyase
MSMSAISWFELPAHELNRAVKFYETILAVSLRREIIGDEMGIFPSGEMGVSGCVVKSEGYEPSATGPVVYLNAEPTLGTVLSRVAPAGGSIVVPATELPQGMGFYAHILDTEGNRVGLHSMKA